MSANTASSGAEVVDPPGFDAFFDHSFPTVMGRALQLAGHRAEAEDAVRHAYAAAWHDWRRVSRSASPDAWVYRVVRQRLWAAARRRSWRRPDRHGLDLPLPPSAGADQTAQARAVLTALGGLPRRQRLVLVMHLLHGMAESEIAAELGVRPASLARILRRARRALVRTLETVAGPLDVDPLLTGPLSTGTAPRVDRWAGDRPNQPGPPDPYGAQERQPGDAVARPGAGADPLVGLLQRTEAWVRAGVLADPGTRQRVRTGVFAGEPRRGRR